jgi:hypothetical protein
LTLKSNGYPTHIIRRGIREGEVIVNRLKKQQLTQQQPTTTATTDPKKKTVFFTLSYYGQETMILANKVRKTCRKLLPHVQLHVAFKKQKTLKQTFLPIQKGLDESKMNKRVIYKIPCKDCDHVYIGETARDRKKRVEEHRSAIKRDDDNSELAQHANTLKHEIDLTKVETLCKESDWRRRIIKEGLHTQEHRGKTINQVKHQPRVF